MIEFPIHYEYLCQRLAYLFGNEKATVKVRREVDYGLSHLTGYVVRIGDFLYPRGNRQIVVRIPNTRKSQHISPDEFAAAMVKILGTYVGATRKTLCMETARVYGFGSTGTAIAASMNEAIDTLVKHGIIDETDGKLSIRE